MNVFCVGLVLMSATVFGWTLNTGTYELSGGNSSRNGTGYQGEVIIAPQGQNYSVIWKVVSRQAQIGVGILKDDILSVSFVDTDNPAFWGVASYRVGPWGELEGTWTSNDGTTQKPEILIWKNSFTY